MPKNILVDLNVILDVLLERPGFEASKDVLELRQSAAYDLYISGHVVTTFAYLLEHAKVPQSQILQQVRWLLQIFSVVATPSDLLKDATHSQVTDYEDAVIEQAALGCRAWVIVSRNTKDFTRSSVKAVSPEVCLKSIA